MRAKSQSSVQRHAKQQRLLRKSLTFWVFFRTHCGSLTCIPCVLRTKWKVRFHSSRSSSFSFSLNVLFCIVDNPRGRHKNGFPVKANVIRSQCYQLVVWLMQISLILPPDEEKFGLEGCVTVTGGLSCSFKHAHVSSCLWQADWNK